MTTENLLSFQDLIDDVLLLILAECDIAGVIAISETSKAFHHLAFSKIVWFSLVSRLVQRRFIDSRPDNGYLKDLSTEQLIDLVKRLLRGPKAWAAPDSRLSAPVESRRIVLHPEITIPWNNKAKLLPGGKYVLFENFEKVEFWSVFEDRLVWKHVPSMDEASVLESAAELVGDDRVVVLTCQRTWALPRKNFIEISTLDTKSGISNLELVSRAPDSSVDNPYTGCAVCGDTVVVYLYRERRVLLVNWRTNSRVLLTTDSIGDCQIAIVPNNLLRTLPDSRHDTERGSRHIYQLAIIPFVSFASWEPNDSVEEPSIHVAAADLPVRPADVIALEGRPIRDRSLWVYESPMQRGRFKIWLHSVVDNEDGNHDILYNCEFARNDTGVSWRLVSSIPLLGKRNLVWMSLSGHTLSSRFPLDGMAVFPPAPLPSEDIESLNFAEGGIHLSSFSGALTYSTNKELVIVYYD
ncbi:hypothetical protein B0H19DRAFT_1260926 [Mycena capillaripes]|nr:hypothetical protein B0H19DRAFT_1260926 [Mycena capillaripes]